MKRRVLVALSTLLCLPPVLPAADDVPAGSALDIAPANTAFFASWSRQGEQLDAVRGSNAFEELMAIPQVRKVLGPLLLGEFDADEPDHVTMRQWLSQPFVQVGLDALSHEIFVYGDASFTAMIKQFQEMSVVGQRARLEALADGKTAEEADRIATTAAIDGLGKVRIPDLVVGFKSEDPLRARSQIMLLDGLIHMALAGADLPPSIRKRYGHEMIQGQQFLTFNLDGSMIPIEQISFDENAAPEVVAATRAWLRGLEFAIAVGFCQDYAILSIGDTTDHLHRLGKEEPLSGHRDLARLRESDEKRFTSIRYMASDYRSAVMASSGHVASLTEFLRRSAEGGGDMSEKTRNKVEAALEALQEENLEDRQPRPASLGFSYLTANGYEGFSYDDAGLVPQPTRPMSVLLHVGSDPVGVVAHRSWLDTVDDYIRFSDSVANALAQFEQMVNVDDQEARYLWYEYCGLARRFDTILREKVVPAIAGGQVALALSATDRSRQWHPEMPIAEKPLPLPELGLVVETNDPEVLLEGVDDAYRVVKETIQLVSSMADEIPPMDPQVEDGVAGRIYYLPMWPELTRIDPDLLAPSAGVSERWLALALRPKTAETLLVPSGWSLPDTTPDEQTSLTAVTHFRPGALVGLVQEWLDYTEQMTADDMTAEDAEVLAIYRAVLRLVGCLKSYVRTTRYDGDMSVVHSVWRFEDRQ